jgi:hypothetical protein
MRRTSLRTFLVSIAFISFGILAMSAANETYKRTDPINFGVDFVRPWNHWDYLATTSFVIFFALLVVSLTFLKKDD